jgi:hypothetical protein
MKKYRIRFNKSRGQPGRGTLDHTWRLFEEDREFIVKNVEINVPSHTEKDVSEDWNIVCYGFMVLDRAKSLAIINEK